MITFVKTLGFISVILAVFHNLTKKYLNPYKLTMIFGKKGCGKSTLLTKLALQYQKKNIPVYSTEPIPGAYLIDPKDVGYAEFPPGSVLLIDEVGMIWDNRGFKSFDNKVRDWFKLQRHRKIRVYLFSQTFDVDKKIRDLTDEMYLVEKKLRVFSYSKRILKRTVLVEAKNSAKGESQLTEDLVFDSFFFFWLGSRKFTFIPRYVGWFDSFVAPALENREFELIPMRIPVKRSRQLLRLPTIRRGRRK